MEYERKRCVKCDRTKSLTEFYKRWGRAGKHYSYCKPCFSGYTKNHYKKNKAAYVRRARTHALVLRAAIRATILCHLQSHGCVDCGNTDIVVLQFDHVRGKKAFNIGDAFRKRVTLARLHGEIKKCEVRCANCHVRRTAQVNGAWILRHLLKPAPL